jgi:hypothetical protein
MNRYRIRTVEEVLEVGAFYYFYNSGKNFKLLFDPAKKN